MRSEQPSLLRGQRFIAIAVLPTVFAASGPNAWASTACTADPVANTAQILCGPSSGPCTSTEVTVSGTIDLLGPTCEFDLGARSLNVTGTLQIAADGRIEIYNVLSATVSGTGKLKARGDLNLPPGQVGSGGNITLLAVDAVLLTSGSLLDVSGDPSGTINVVGSTITTQAGSLIRGNGVAAVTIEGDGGTVQLVGLTGYVLMGGAIEMRGQSDGQGGEVFASAATDVTLAAFVDVSGGSGDGGVIELAAGDHVAITHTLDMDSRGDGGSGGSLNIEAGNDSLGGAVAGGSVSIDNVTLKMRGSSGDGFGGDGGTLDISAKGNIALVGSAFTLRADAATALDGFGGSVVLDSTDDSPVSIGPLDGDITIAGAILAKGGSDGGTGGAFLASAGRAFSTTAQIDLAGRQGGGELLVEAGDAVVWNGTLIAEATSAAGEPGIVSMLAGSAVNAPLTIVSNVLAAGGAQSSAGYEILLSGCQLTVEESVKIDGTAGFGGSKIELISLDAMHLKSASKYLASANGHVVLTHPTTITPLIGSNATFNPPYTDNPTADAPYPGCGLIPTPTPQPTFTPGPTSQETPDPLPPGASSGEPPREDRISAAVYERLMRDDRIPVMIVFAPPSVPFGSARGRSERRAWQDTEAPRWRGAIQQNSQRVLDFLAGTDFEVRFRYNYIPALSGYVTIRGVEALRNNPLVMAVDVLPATEASLLQAREWTDLQAVHNLRSLPSPPGAPFDGSGVTIGIIDGGVDSNTPDIDHAQVVDQRCFCVDPCPPPPNVAEDNTGGHGTQHTGVLISNGSGAGAPLGSSVGSNAKGAAKGASVIALKVACPGSSLAETADQIVAAFDWVLANPTAVDVISNSWQFTGVFPIPCDGHSANTQAVAAAVGQLRFLGIPSFMAAGNEASGTPVHPAFGIKQPSCVEDAITVGAVGDNFAPGTSSQGKPDELTGFSNFDPLMDLVDVGEHLVVAGLGGIVPTDPATGFPMIWGTSFATPMAAACFASLRSAFPAVPSEWILEAMLASPVRVKGRDGVTYIPRTHCLDAFRRLSDEFPGTREPECPATPRPSCRKLLANSHSRLKMRYDNDEPAKGKLDWTWSKGANPQTLVAELGDPRIDSSAALCLYDANELRFGLVLGAGGWCRERDRKCWKLNSVGTQFAYADTKPYPRHALQKARLRGRPTPGGGSTPKLFLAAKGAGSVPPFSKAGSEFFPFPLRVQLINHDTGICWEATYTDSTKVADTSYGAKFASTATAP